MDESEIRQDDRLKFEVNDLEFCSACGTILPLPTYDDVIMCRLCKKKFPINGSFHLHLLFKRQRQR